MKSQKRTIDNADLVGKKALTSLQKGCKSRVDLRKMEFVGQIARKLLNFHVNDLNFADIERNVGRNLASFKVSSETDLYCSGLRALEFRDMCIGQAVAGHFRKTDFANRRQEPSRIAISAIAHDHPVQYRI